MATIKPIIDSALDLKQIPERIKGKEGTLDGDLYRVFRTLSTNEEREAALKRLVDKDFKFPLYPERWKANVWKITEKLSERAEEHNTTIQEEFSHWVMASINIAIQLRYVLRVRVLYTAELNIAHNFYPATRNP